MLDMALANVTAMTIRSIISRRGACHGFGNLRGAYLPAARLGRRGAQKWSKGLTDLAMPWGTGHERSSSAQHFQSTFTWQPRAAAHLAWPARRPRAGELAANVARPAANASGWQPAFWRYLFVQAGPPAVFLRQPSRWHPTSAC